MCIKSRLMDIKCKWLEHYWNLFCSKLLARARAIKDFGMMKIIEQINLVPRDIKKFVIKQYIR